MTRQTTSRSKMPLLCRYFHHSYECPFELRSGRCSNIHEAKVREIFIWITKHKEEGYTELDLDSFIEKAAPNIECDRLDLFKHWINTYPNPPREEDLKRFKSVMEKKRMEDLAMKYYGDQ